MEQLLETSGKHWLLQEAHPDFLTFPFTPSVLFKFPESSPWERFSMPSLDLRFFLFFCVPGTFQLKDNDSKG